MSYYVLIEDFRRWLNRAQTALVSKNKVRKDLWTDFTEILHFEPNPDVDVVTISKTNYTSISTFLQTEGRSDNLQNDSILNWVNTLHELRQLLNEEVRYLTQQAREFHKLSEARTEKEFEAQMRRIQKYLTPRKPRREEEEEKPPQPDIPPTPST